MTLVAKLSSRISSCGANNNTTLMRRNKTGSCKKPGHQKIKFGVNATSSARSFFGAVRKIEFYSPPSASADKNHGALKVYWSSRIQEGNI